MKVFILLNFLLLVTNGLAYSPSSKLSVHTHLTCLQNSRLAEILAEQGLSMDELLSMQEKFVVEKKSEEDILSAEESRAQADLEMQKSLENKEKSRRIKAAKALRAKKAVVEVRPSRGRRDGPSLPNNAPHSSKASANESVKRLPEKDSDRLPKMRVEDDFINSDRNRLAKSNSPSPSSPSFSSSPSAPLPSSLSSSIAPAIKEGKSNMKKEKKVHVELTGVKLQDQLEFLVERLGFPALFEFTGMRCFENKPTIKSSLKALRNASSEWARKKIEYLYIQEYQRSEA